MVQIALADDPQHSYEARPITSGASALQQSEHRISRGEVPRDYDFAAMLTSIRIIDNRLGRLDATKLDMSLRYLNTLARAPVLARSLSVIDQNTQDYPGPLEPVERQECQASEQAENAAFEAWFKHERQNGASRDSAWVGWQAGARMAAPAAGGARKPDLARAEQIAADFMQDYEWRGEDVVGRDTCYTPNKRDRAMITDAILGLQAEPELIAAISAQVPKGKGG